jgi:membrane fusion protein (multidrug efflux system)
MALMGTSIEIERPVGVSALIPVLRFLDSEHDGSVTPKARARLPEAREPSPPVEPAGEQPTATRKRPLRAALIVGASLISLAGATYFGWQYWTIGRLEDRRCLRTADNTTIAPKVSGYIGAVLVGDNERVRAGQVLTRIDDRDFKVALDQA